MNDPNDTDDGLLEDLEQEYLELAAAGDYKAIDYALAESEVFNAEVLPTLMGLMQITGGLDRLETIGTWARIARKRLVESLTKDVAPKWAAQELPKRVAATEEMVAEWAKEAA